MIALMAPTETPDMVEVFVHTGAKTFCYGTFNVTDADRKMRLMQRGIVQLRAALVEATPHV